MITHNNVTYSDVIELIDQRNIICIFQGQSEAGPRALGNRSILYDPRDTNALNVNEAKGREWWRPFAGTVLLEYAHDWFEMLTLEESPFMMYAIPIKEDKKHLIPGIMHVDGTSRIQTITEEQNYHYYHLIKTFYEKTGIPILFNTSLNLAGQVLCHTMDDVFYLLDNSPIKYVYLPESSQLMLKSKD
jgi:carbamoyltransferase